MHLQYTIKKLLFFIIWMKCCRADFRLSDSESSEEEGENVYTYSGKRNLARGEVVALSKAVSSGLLKIITTLVNLVLCLLFLRLVMTVVVRMIIRKRP